LRHKKRIGQYNRRVTIQRLQTTVNAIGDAVESWVDVATVWASVDGQVNREETVGDRETPVQNYRVCMRYLPGILPSMRALYDGRELDIRGVVDREERREELVLNCEEKWVE